MKNKTQNIDLKWVLPGTGEGDLKLGIELLVLSLLYSLLPFPEGWQTIVEVGASALLVSTALIWAGIATDAGWLLVVYFFLGVIPHVRLVVFLCVAVCRIGICLWDKMQEA